MIKKKIGLRNIVTTKDKWYYLVLYDIDSEMRLSVYQYRIIDSIMKDFQCSYLLYSTKHGYHIVGLSPSSLLKCTYVFNELDKEFGTYFSGQTIRVSLKEGEKQNLIEFKDYGNIIPNLFNMYADRFNLPKMEVPFPKKYYLVFEKYWTDKT